MKKDIRELIREKRIFLDGGTGTVLQSLGLPFGTAPEEWNDGRWGDDTVAFICEWDE